MPETTSEELKLPDIAAKLRELRIMSGKSAQTLADEICIDQSTLSKYENGRRAVPLSVLEQIATALGQPPVAVVAWCLKQKYPELAAPKTKVSRLLSQLEKDISTRCRFK